MKAAAKKPVIPQPGDAGAGLTKRKRRSRVTVKIDHPQHGKMEVHSLKAVLHGEPCVLKAGSALGTNEMPVWIQLAKQGRFLGHSAGPFEMTGKTFEEIVRNFKGHPEHIPIDFEHVSESDASSGSIPHTGAPAQGWIVDMKVERGELYGLVEWGPLARDYIKNGQYKYFSPAIRFGAKDRVSGAPIGARMTSGALTNSPFLSGLQKVAAKDVESGADLDIDEDDDELEDLLPASAGHQPADLESDMELEKKLKDTEDKLAITNDKFTMADTKAKDLEKTVLAKEAEVVTLREENKGLMAWKTGREESDNKAEVEIAFETYKDQRKLSDAMKEPMLAMLKAAPVAFRTMYPVVPLANRHLLRNVIEKRETLPNEVDPKGRVNGDIVKLSDKIRKENPKLTQPEALIEADKQIRAARRSV